MLLSVLPFLVIVLLCYLVSLVCKVMMGKQRGFSGNIQEKHECHKGPAPWPHQRHPSRDTATPPRWLHFLKIGSLQLGFPFMSLILSGLILGEEPKIPCPFVLSGSVNTLISFPIPTAASSPPGSWFPLEATCTSKWQTQKPGTIRGEDKQLPECVQTHERSISCLATLSSDSVSFGERLSELEKLKS